MGGGPSEKSVELELGVLVEFHTGFFVLLSSFFFSTYGELSWLSFSTVVVAPGRHIGLPPSRSSFRDPRTIQPGLRLAKSV